MRTAREVKIISSINKYKITKALEKKRKRELKTIYKSILSSANRGYEYCEVESISNFTIDVLKEKGYKVERAENRYSFVYIVSW